MSGVKRDSEPAEILVDLISDPPLAEVIPMPRHEQGSFYTRNSAALPRLESSTSSRYERASLPKPVEAEPDTVFNRFKDFVKVNRPAWLPQR